MDQPTPPYYDKRLPDGTLLDVYAICQLYGVTAPPVFHAIKKLLRAGKGSGGKSLQQDVAEARNALNRFLEMTVEEKPKGWSAEEWDNFRAWFERGPSNP